MNTAHTLATLRAQITKTLGSLIPRGATVALLDFPNYSNVGDSAIWLGEIAYLKSEDCSIQYICDAYNFSSSALRSALPTGIIILNGGGNFGDLYPLHQRFRERVVKEFPNHRIIQFPQSIHFSSEHDLRHSMSIFSGHADFHLCVRDVASMEIAKRHMRGPLHLCPDMALMLDLPIFSTMRKTTEVVILSRTDQEKREVQVMPAQNASFAILTDWLDEHTPRHAPLYIWANRRLSWGNSKFPRLFLNRVALYAANHMARQRLQRGVDLLSQGHVVVTDRLHAMILSWLGRAPVIYLDNSYGKLSNFINTWTLQGDLTAADSFSAALSTASELRLQRERLLPAKKK